MKLQDARMRAYAELEKHGLYAQGWRFAFDKSVSRFGCCHGREKLITLSKKLTQMNTDEEVVDVILHEMAHALTPRVRGHGNVWKAMAVRLGARPEACYSSAKVVTPPKAFVGVCPLCAERFERHRRPSGGGYCNKCYKRLGETRPRKPRYANELERLINETMDMSGHAARLRRHFAPCKLRWSRNAQSR